MVLEFPFGLEKFRAFTVEEEEEKKRGKRRREEEKEKKKEEGKREAQEFKVWLLVKELYEICVWNTWLELFRTCMEFMFGLGIFPTKFFVYM